MSWLVILVLIGLAIWLGQRGNKQQSLAEDRKVRDARWLEFIGSYRKAARSERERRMIEALLAGGTVDEFLTKDANNNGATDDAGVPQVAIPSEAALATGDAATQVTAFPAPAKVSRPMDGTLLLLYFGAFLFVASAGLFVAFGDFSGAMRTVLVFLTMAALYGGGLWLHGRSARLKPAGISFVAIGLAIAPLVGVAAYNYLTVGPDGLSGRVVWLLTSLLCLGLYAHATWRLRTTLLPYLLIASFVSLFESGVAVLDAPAPYFVWGLIVAGLILRGLSLARRTAILDEPADRSAQLLVPLSVFGALFMLPDHGAGQLAIALTLAAAYYGLEAYARRGQDNTYIAATHVLLIAALASVVYAVFETWSAVAICLMAVALLHIPAVLLWSGRSYGQDGATVAFGAAAVAVLTAVGDAQLMVAGLSVVTVFGGLTAWKQRRTDAYAGSAAALIAVPWVAGQLLAEPSFTADLQSAALYVAALVLLLAVELVFQRTASREWRDVSVAMCLLAGTLAVLPAWVDGGMTAVAGSVALAALLVRCGYLHGEAMAWPAAGAVLAAPAVLLVGDTGGMPFFAAVGVAVLGNAALALTRRHEANRWLLVAASMLLPVALGSGALGFEWQAAGFAYAYLAVMIGLVYCRSLSRRSSIEPHGGDGTSYLAGYLSAATLAIAISLADSDSQLHSSLILAVLLGMSLFLSLRVEARRDILAFTPWLAQAVLASAVRPGFSDHDGSMLILGSTVLAALLFGAADELQGRLGAVADVVRRSVLVAAYVPLWLGFYYETDDIVLPFSLAVAGGLTLYYCWRRSQQARELSGAVLVLALLWGLSVAGYDNTQVQTHIIAATCAGYAWWRHYRGEAGVSRSYLQAMFWIATVPLVLQALGGSSGDLYGWWLILQQVGFMVLGVAINRRFLTWWGLYVSVAAILYQLRDLGWAALTVLALFVIGVAVYRLQHTADKSD